MTTSATVTELPVRAPSTGGRSAPARRSPWVQFAIKRSVGLLATIVVVIVITFLIVKLIPGDPAVAAAGMDATAERIAQIRAEMGLDLPVWQQFFTYVGGVLTGDLGTSFAMRAPVSDIILARLPFTASLALISMTVVLLVAVPLGLIVAAATRGGRRRWAGEMFGLVTGGISAVPPYIIATVLVIIFAVTLQWLPPAFSANRPGVSFVLPVIALSIVPICIIARVVRRETAVALEQDYIRTARGWRVSEWRLFTKYLVPNILTSTLTLSGLILTSLLGGAIIVETVFAWPGLGLGIVNAIIARDYPLIQGTILVLAVLAAVLTILVDVLLGIVDRRTLGDAP